MSNSAGLAILANRNRIIPNLATRGSFESAVRIRPRGFDGFAPIVLARHESAATRTVHRRRCVSSACAARPMHVVSASMSRRDLNFPTLGALPPPRGIPRASSSSHCIALTRCNYFPSLPARLRIPLPSHRLPACASTCALENSTRVHAHTHARAGMQVQQCQRARVYVTRSLCERKNSESSYRKRFLILVKTPSAERIFLRRFYRARKRETRVSSIDRSARGRHDEIEKAVLPAKRKECHTLLFFPDNGQSLASFRFSRTLLSTSF